jgi:hypothetical protein
MLNSLSIGKTLSLPLPTLETKSLSNGKGITHLLWDPKVYYCVQLNVLYIQLLESNPVTSDSATQIKWRQMVE